MQTRARALSLPQVRERAQVATGDISIKGQLRKEKIPWLLKQQDRVVVVEEVAVVVEALLPQPLQSEELAVAVEGVEGEVVEEELLLPLLVLQRLGELEEQEQGAEAEVVAEAKILFVSLIY